MKKAAGIFLLLMLAMMGMGKLSYAVEDKKTPSNDSLMKRQKAEILGYFLDESNQAKLPKTPIAAELYNQAVQYFQNNDYALARQALNESISYDDKNPLAYELLGDLDYYEQNLPGALENYKKAFRLNPDKKLREKIEKLMQEIALGGQLSTVQEEDFIFQYQGEKTLEEVKEIQGILKEAHDSISAEFGYSFKQPVVVVIYQEEEFKEITQLPHWVGGVYDGKIKLPPGRNYFTEKDFEALIWHEMTHAVVGAISGRQAPPWIQEGLAEYEENKIRPADNIIFLVAVQTGHLIPLDQLMSEQNVITENQDPITAGLFYEQSYSLVNYLIQKYGIFKIKQLLVEYSKGKDSDEALREVFKIDSTQLEKEWKATLTTSSN